MKFAEAARKVRQMGGRHISGNIQQGDIVCWETRDKTLMFVPDHAYTKEGELVVKRKPDPVS